MSKFVIVGQDGTRYVFKAETLDVVARGKKVFVNDTPLAEYLSVGDAREAAEIFAEELESFDEEHLLPVKHFQAEPFVECAWARDSIDVFLEVVKKLPRDFINEFFRTYRHDGLEKACDTAKEVTEYACTYEAELTAQADAKTTVVIGKGEDTHERD